MALYGTALRLYLQLGNKGASAYTVTIAPTECCLIIDKDDVDCQTMSFTNEAVLQLRPQNSGSNDTGRASFSFYNMYARYRNGSCSFTLHVNGEQPHEWSHTVKFNTYPDIPTKCSGVDQDPDRNCSPVDCAIKYKGQRNFYRNSTGKCEAVVHCSTLGKDGLTTIAFYDWENNACQQLDWLQKDNFASQIESDNIPTQLKLSRRAQQFEPEPPTDSVLDCNNGHQDGTHCVCDEGWTSSGIHGSNVLTFYWCDMEKIDPSTMNRRPRRFHWLQEAAIVALFSLANIAFVVMWVAVVLELWWELCCSSCCCSGLSPVRMIFICLRQMCRKKGSLDLQDDE